MRPLAFVLPLLALFAVVAAGSVLWLSSAERSPRRHAAEATAELATPTVVPESARPRLKPGQTVCQGTLHVPEKGQAQTFPALYSHIEEELGIAVVGSENVPQEAFDEARRTIARLFANNDLVDGLVEQGSYVIIVDRGKGVLDLPEFACLEGRYSQDFFNHVCGIADRADYPVATVNTADLLGERRGPCGGLNILFHELGHLVQNWSISPPDYFDIKLLYQDALDAGKYRRQYAATNPNEYFAEATQSYFLAGDPGGARDRRWLESYDPQIYALLERVYGR